MQIQFDSISELGGPGSKFKDLFDSYWPAYRDWLMANKSDDRPDLKTSVAALEKYMPEMVPLYSHICQLVNADPLAEQFLTGFEPPAYISACSQAVLTKGEIQLVRNHDYHPDLLEGTILLSDWNGKKVMAASDCLMGAVDGINEGGLAISLTFGGRKVVGSGFGIPFILRYVLEFCTTVQQAVDALTRIPCHMSYNVTVVDKTGEYKTVLLAPDREPLITNDAFTTNHQIKVDWTENAKFNKTIERSAFLKDLLNLEELDADTLTAAFLKEPLYNTRFKQGFGTLYTAVYRPQKGTMELLWLEESVIQSFDNFQEGSLIIKFPIPPEEEKFVPDEKRITAFQDWIAKKGMTKQYITRTNVAKER